MKHKRWDLILARDGRAFTVEAVTSTKAVGRGAKGQRREFDLERLERASGMSTRVQGWHETEEDARA